MEGHFREHGTRAIVDGFPALPMPEPLQLTGRAGDVVLAHYALAHAAAPNLGPHVRYAVFFRLYHADHDQAGTRPLTQLWTLWEGLRDVVPA
jgi:ectoine hydroxylase-related dioxygenase (phytanoyl-CoA dioxygenase family)